MVSMVLSGCQWLLVVLTCYQCSQRLSVVLDGCHAVVLNGSQWLSMALSGSQWLPVFLNGYQ